MNYSKDKSNALNIVKKRKIKILLKEPKNKECFECSSLFPEFISLNNGIFICKNCVKNHLKFPKSISDIYLNDLNYLSLKEIQYLSCGGNRKLIQFINMEYPNLTKLSPIYFYQTYAMDYYRKYLQYLIEGGNKPTKPDQDKAYELITHKYFNNNAVLSRNENLPLNKKNKTENNSMIKNDSYIKINKNNVLYPKIKPIVGRKNECSFTRSLSRHNKLFLKDLSLTSSNYNILNHLNKSLKEEKFNSSSTDFKYRYNSSHFKNNYDTDGNYDDMNDLNDINENEINDQINNMSNIKELNELTDLSININNNENLKAKNRINRRNRDDMNIKVFKINNNSTNNTISNIYSKPTNNNYLNTFEENNNYSNINRNFFNNEIYTNSNKIYNISESNNIFSIEDLRNYLTNNKKNQKEKYIFNLKQNSNKPILIEDINLNGEKIEEKEQKRNFNNINNNIIINRNLNVFCSNNNLHKIFKKKPIGNSFSINDKNYKNDKSNFSTEKSHNNQFFMTSTDEKNMFKIKRKIKIKNEYKKKLCNKLIERNNESTFIRVNIKNSKLKPNKTMEKINNISFGNLKSNPYNKIVIEKKGPNNNNNMNIQNNDNEDINLKSKLIQRISRVMKIKNVKKQKIKSFEKIKVTQKDKNNNNNIKEMLKNLNNSKLNYIEVNKLEKKEKNKSNSEARIRTAKSYSNILDIQKRKLVLMKELINLPNGKRKNILEIIKTNNMANKSVSPSAKRILEIFTEPKIRSKKILEINI